MTSIWKSNLFVKLKKNVFKATDESILVYGSITCTLTSSLEKKVDETYTRMLRTIREHRMSFSGHWWRSRKEMISEVETTADALQMN